MPETETNFFAQTNFRQTKKKFGIKLDDRRQHFYVIGKTGVGKTAMIKNMAIQDIVDGKGIAFIDPHGEAVEELLDHIPKERVKDVVYFNPSDLAYPIGFNIMEITDPEMRHLIAGGLMGVFKKIWPDVWSARMEYILHNCILALLEYPDSTILGVNRMLSDVDYRRKVIEKVTDPVVKAFWTQEFARYTQRYEVEASAAIQNKVGQFSSNPLVRNIIGQVKSTIDMREIMDEGKILLLNLSKGRIGEDGSALLGALAITKLYLAAMSRVDIPEQKRKDFLLYVDEFQNFATESFASILSEARKYRMSLILAHQYIAQLEDIVRDAVFGNVGTMVIFRIGAEDAEFLEKEFSPIFIAEDLVNLSKYDIYLKLMINGVASKPFSAQTLVPFPKLKKSFREEIIESSRKKYGKTRADVENRISKWSKTEDTRFRERNQRDNRRDNRPSRPRQTAVNRNFRTGQKQSIPLKKTEEKPSIPLKKIEEKPSIPIEQAIKENPIPFAIPRKKIREEKNKNKNSVDVDALKQVIGEALDKGLEKPKKSGTLEPGEKVNFD